MKKERICPRCKVLKSIDDFEKYNTGLRKAYCISCGPSPLKRAKSRKEDSYPFSVIEELLEKEGLKKSFLVKNGLLSEQMLFSPMKEKISLAKAREIAYFFKYRIFFVLKKISDE